MMHRFIAILGIVAILGVAHLCCPRDRRRRVNWHTVGRGMLILLIFAVLVLRTPLRGVFIVANDVVGKLLDFSREGASFLFGKLVTDTESFGYVFAFHILPTIIFLRRSCRSSISSD